MRLIVFFIGCLLACASAAQADPCTAISDDGTPPPWLNYGSTFSGEVVAVLDGDSLCVAVGPRRGLDWVEVRLADFYAPELGSSAGPRARAALERIALGRQVTCKAGMGTYDRIAARCAIDGRAVGDSMRAAGVTEGGNGLAAPQTQTRGLYGSQARSAPSSAYRSCAAARAAGAAPLYRGSPGYNPNLDGDGDGIACEPYRGR